MWNRAGFLGLYILKPNLPLNGQAASSTDIFFFWCVHMKEVPINHIDYRSYFIQRVCICLCIIVYM